MKRRSPRKKPPTLRLAVAGATGRMGRTLIRLIAADSSLHLVAALAADRDPLLGRDAGAVAGVDQLSVPISTDFAGDVDVLVEFTLPEGCVQWARWCTKQGIPMVSGTTGLSSSQQGILRTASRFIPIVWAPNMSVGVNLLRQLVGELAAKLGPEWDIEICEAHHRHKVDAPSGTARSLLAAVCEGRGVAVEKNAVYGRAGDIGPRPPGEIGVHAVRMGEIVGEHEVHFTSAAESLSLRHRAFSRDTFAAGALRAARWLAGRRAGWYTMAEVLGGDG